jgi:hypothetical protein
MVSNLVPNPSKAGSKQETEQTAQCLLVGHVETSYRAWLKRSGECYTKLCDVASGDNKDK